MPPWRRMTGVGAALGPEEVEVFGFGPGHRGWSGAGVVQGPYEAGPGVGDDLEYRSVGGLGVADGDDAGQVAGDFDALAVRVAAAVRGLPELVVGHGPYISLRMLSMSLTELLCASPSRVIRSKVALWCAASVSLSNQTFVDEVSTCTTSRAPGSAKETTVKAQVIPGWAPAMNGTTCILTLGRCAASSRCSS